MIVGGSSEGAYWSSHNAWELGVLSRDGCQLGNTTRDRCWVLTIATYGYFVMVSRNKPISISTLSAHTSRILPDMAETAACESVLREVECMVIDLRFRFELQDPIPELL